VLQVAWQAAVGGLNSLTSNPAQPSAADSFQAVLDSIDSVHPSIKYLTEKQLIVISGRLGQGKLCRCRCHVIVVLLPSGLVHLTKSWRNIANCEIRG
jgi:hypothetical protein